MRFTTQIISGVLLNFLLQSFFPWWTLVLGMALTGFYFAGSGFRSFLAGFISAAILWLAFASYHHFVSDGLLTQKIDNLFPVPAFVLTTLIGGIAGGFSSLTGSLLRKL